MILREEIKHILEHAILAPSMLNTQPWKFSINSDSISLYVDESCTSLFCDPSKRNLYLSMGGVIENVCLSAGFLGLETHISYFPHKYNLDYVAEISFEKKANIQSEDDLYKAIPLRRTNRRKYSPRIILPHEREELERVCGKDSGITLVFKKNEMLKKAILISDKLRFSNPNLVKEFTDLMKSRSKRVGLGIDSLRIGWEKSLLWDVFARVWTGVNFFGAFFLVPFYYTRRHLVNTSTICWLSVDDASPSGVIKAGRAMQRLLLKATTMGIHSHMINFPLMYLYPLNVEFSKDEKEQIEEMRELLRGEVLENDMELVSIFRLGYGKRSNTPTYRKPLESFLIKRDPFESTTV